VHSALETADLWEGALLLVHGARLLGVRVSGNGHKTAFFLFEGEDLVAVARAYRDGSAVAPVRDMRERLNELRDALFRELRPSAREPQETKENAPCRRPDTAARSKKTT
jgi:hypothetical protein